MPAEPFADRLDPATYADDVLVGVYESDPGEPDALWLSERLMARLVHAAIGYELHTLPMLAQNEPLTLNRARTESLEHEIAFVGERLDDPVAAQTVMALSAYISERLRRPGWDGPLTFDAE